MGGIISGGKGPLILFPLQNREAGKVKVNIGLIKIVASLNKVREEIKDFREVIRVFTQNL